MSAALPLWFLSFLLGHAGKGVLVICIASTRADSSRPRRYAVAQIARLFWAESFRDKREHVCEADEGQDT